MNNTKKIIEYSVISLFALILIVFSSIMIHRAITRSDWYHRLKLENGLNEVSEKLENKDNFDYLGIVGERSGIRYFYDFDESLFSDITCPDYTEIIDDDQRHAILNSPSVTVFHKDGSQTSFFITEDLKIYYGMMMIECQSLLNWYLTHKDITL